MTDLHPVWQAINLRKAQKAIEGATADLIEDRTRSEAWRACAAEYVTDATFQINDEWSRFDDEASAQALLDIQRAYVLPPDEFKVSVGKTLIALIQHCAVLHANTCENAGRI